MSSSLWPNPKSRYVQVSQLIPLSEIAVTLSPSETEPHTFVFGQKSSNLQPVEIADGAFVDHVSGVECRFRL